MLSLVGTPIGNLGDMTFRAVETLEAADLIACEDTRTSGRLRAHFEIDTPLISYHEHNEARRTAEFLPQLAEGKHIALISDAGMPIISDPGRRLVQAAIAEGIAIEVIPGVSAVTTAVAGAGLNVEDGFCFGGFLPNKSGRRTRILTEALQSGRTQVFYESPHRLLKTLAALEDLAPDCHIVVARELTKKFEEFQRGTPGSLKAHYTEKPPKGEITICLTTHSQ